jgi:hypothetical protein
MISTLTFLAGIRAGEKYPTGGYKSSRSFFDVIVDGSSLWERLGKPDLVSVLCSDFTLPETLKAVDRLLLRCDADLPNDRRSLFICAECGDLGCGTVSVMVTRAADLLVWSDFGYENTNEERISRYGDIGPFQFDRERYESAFLEVMAQLKSSKSILGWIVSSSIVEKSRLHSFTRGRQNDPG